MGFTREVFPSGEQVTGAIAGEVLPSGNKEPRQRSDLRRRSCGICWGSTPKRRTGNRGGSCGIVGEVLRRGKQGTSAVFRSSEARGKQGTWVALCMAREFPRRSPERALGSQVARTLLVPRLAGVLPCSEVESSRCPETIAAVAQIVPGRSSGAGIDPAHRQMLLVSLA